MSETAVEKWDWHLGLEQQCPLDKSLMIDFTSSWTSPIIPNTKAIL
jgi:hypothetical protein